MKKVCKIINEDGTDFNPPKNPLMEKWLKEFPPTPMAEYSQVCDVYSCMFCGRCPYGENWKPPEEDMEAYQKYLNDHKEYMILHNPGLYGRRTEVSSG